MEETWITAADITPDGEHLILLSGKFFYVFSCFEGTKFFEGAQVRLQHSNLSQKEGMVIAPDNRVYVTDERFGGFFGGNLYRANLQPWTIEPSANLGNDTTLAADSLYIYAGNAGSTYNWSDGQTTQGIWVKHSGTWSVTVTAPNGCIDSDTIQVELLTGISEIQDQLTFQLSPNPAHKIVEIWMSVSGTYFWSLKDLAGKTLKQGTTFGEKTAVSLKEIPSGIYHIEIITLDDQRLQKRLIVE